MRNQVSKEFLLIVTITLIIIIIVVFIIKNYINSTRKNIEIRYEQVRQTR